MNNIYCIWSGNNDMSDNRKNSLQCIIDNSGCNVILVSPKNLKDFEIKSHPIHPAYEYLSLTHRSDYLRAYIMHHHGGGYSDIKYNKFNWTKYFDLLNNSSHVLFIGYQERQPQHIASDDPKIIRSFNMLCGCGHFIFKPNTLFTSLWLNKINSILSLKISLLKKYPGHHHPRATTGGVHGTPGIHTDSKYPLGWNEILGKIIHPLMYNFKNQYLYSMPYPNLYFYQ